MTKGVHKHLLLCATPTKQKCFKKTFQWIDKYEMELKNWDKASKESIAVAVCNGAVYEPKLKTK